MLRLYVDMDEMQHQINRMNELCDVYHFLYGTLFSKVDESALYWKGKDQQAFLSRIHNFEGDFDKMHELLLQYTDFLEKSLQAYRMCQDEAEASSLRLG